MGRPVVVFVSKSEADGRAIQRIGGQTGQPTIRVTDVKRAREQIRKLNPGLVLCDTDLDGDQSWRELLEEAQTTGFALIVVSRLPSEALWAEVLNLGGFDVLALPFDRDEVERAVESALQHCGRAKRLSHQNAH